MVFVAFAVEIFIRDLGLSVKATKLPVMTSEKELSCNFSGNLITINNTNNTIN